MKRNEKAQISRRDFIKIAVGSAAAMATVGTGCTGKAKTPRKAKQNPFVRYGKPLLVSVEGNDPYRMLLKGLEALGGLKHLVGDGRKVLLKPNFVFPQAFPITTDPEIIFIMAHLLRETGASEVEVFDAPGTYLVGSQHDTFKFYNLAERGKDRGLKVTCGDSGRRQEYVNSRKGEWKVYPEIAIHRNVYNAPAIINMPCLKRHHTSYLTCALKNNFGAVYGAQRWDAHIRGEGFRKQMMGAKERANAPFNNVTHFMTALAEFADAVRPELSFVDARSILTRGGPTRGKGDVKRGINRFIFSGDMVALDVYCSKIMEEHDETYTTQMILPYLKAAENLGLGTMNLEKVTTIELSL